LLFVIRADASQSIGTGHIMRCLTLAKRIRSRGADVNFICRDLPSDMSEYIKGQGFKVHLLPRDKGCEEESRRPEQLWSETMWELDALQTIRVLMGLGRKIDWLIVDHYGVDHQWQSRLRAQVQNIMVIDDLANRRHECNLLLDQNYYHNRTERYYGLVPKDCSLVLGPHYVLLREEFYIARKKMRIRTGEVSNVLIFYGGADSTNETEKCLTVLMDYFNSGIEINVVIGHSNVNKERIENLCSSRENINYHCQVSNMAELINKADLAFGAGGSNTWERCFLGLPSIVTVTADNQLETTAALAEQGAIRYLGWHDKVTPDMLVRAAKSFLKRSRKLTDMQKTALDIMGIEGSLGIEELMNKLIKDSSGLG
jgi:UDP-2,4-diacetamido-2,4,6-trideoxy-beta-L-altropyranose hydrolase